MFRKIGTTIVVQVISLVFGIGTSILLNRQLQPDGRGLLVTYLTALDLISIIGSLGLHKSFIYYVARGEDKVLVVGSAMGTTLLNTLVVMLITVPLLFVQISVVVDQLPASAIWLSLPCTALLLLTGALNSIVRGLNKIDQCNIGVIIGRISYTALIMFLALTPGLTVELAIWAFVFAQVPETLYYVWVIRRTSTRFIFGWSENSMFVSYGLQYVFYSVLARLHSRVDVLLLTAMSTVAQVGHYATAVTLVQMLLNIPFALNMVLFPHVAERSKHENISLETARYARYATLMLFAVGAVLFMVAPFGIELLYGPEYLPAVNPLRLLLPGVITYSIGQVVSAHLMGRNRAIALGVWTGISTAANVLLNLLMIPRWGIEGAALASTLSYTLQAVAFAYLLTQEQKVSLVDVFVPRWSDVQSIWTAVTKRLLLKRNPQSESANL